MKSLEEISRQLVAREAPVCLSGLKGGARTAALAELARAHGDRPMLVIAPSSKACDALGDDLRSLLGGDDGEGAARIKAFPRHDTLPYERFSPQPFVVAQRMELLYRWLSDAGEAAATPITVAPWTALTLRVPSRDAVRAALGGRARLVTVGFVVARPGDGDQNWHVDGVHRSPAEHRGAAGPGRSQRGQGQAETLIIQRRLEEKVGRLPSETRRRRRRTCVQVACRVHRRAPQQVVPGVGRLPAERARGDSGNAASRVHPCRREVPVKLELA